MARRDLRWSPCRIRPCKTLALQVLQHLVGTSLFANSMADGSQGTGLLPGSVIPHALTLLLGDHLPVAVAAARFLASLVRETAGWPSSENPRWHGD